MKSNYILLAGVSGVVVFIVLASMGTVIPQAHAQSQNETKTSVEYIENARSILKQVSIEYKNGNYNKSSDLAVSAYLDNIEYAETDLKNNGQSELVQQLETMMVTDLMDMIKNRVSQDQLDSEISAIDAKLAQAIAVVPEFPVGGMTLALVSAIVASIIALTRFNGRARWISK